MTLEQRLRRAAPLLERHGLGAVVLRRPPSFAWWTGGGDSRVDLTSAEGVASAVIGADGRSTVVTSEIEAGRVAEEVAPGFEVRAYPWTGSPDEVLAELAGGRPIGSDLPSAGEVDVSAEVTSLRLVLDDDALAQYRSVGRDAVAATVEALAQLSPSMTEVEARGVVHSACSARGLQVPVLLVGGSERLGRHRHPVATSARLGDRWMVVVCGERHGLYANLTRIVHEGTPDPAWREHQDVCEAILRRLREEVVRPGVTLGAAFAAVQAMYAEAGHPDEWRRHHQGGLTGYQSREVVAQPGSDLVVEAGMAFAWNPSLTGGAKAEETYVLAASGPEVLTVEGS